MKKRILTFLALICIGLAIPAFESGCSSPPAGRVAQVQTLKAVGHSAEAAVEMSARLYRDGHITAAQARQIIDFYNRKFQPAFRLASTAVQSNLDSIASPAVMELAAQLSSLVINLQSPHP